MNNKVIEKVGIAVMGLIAAGVWGFAIISL